MKTIEEAVKTTFPNAHIKALVNLMYTYHYFKKPNSNYFKEFGITSQQYNVLRILRGKHPEAVNPGYIKEVMIEPSPDLTRLVDRLVNKTLVHRQICKENRRQVELFITDDGLKMLEDIAPIQQEKLKQFDGKLTEKEAEQLSSLLDKLRS